MSKGKFGIGGRPRVGVPSMVGERGREAILPCEKIKGMSEFRANFQDELYARIKGLVELYDQSEYAFKGNCYDFFEFIKSHEQGAGLVYHGNHVLCLLGGIVFDKKNIYIKPDAKEIERLKAANNEV